MSEMKEKKRLQLPEELLKHVSGGYKLDQLTPEELAHMDYLGKALGDAYVHGTKESLQSIIDMIHAFDAEMIAKYGE